MKQQNTVIEAAVESEQVEPAGLVTLAELAGEGFGWDGQFIRTPKDAVDVLARQLAGLVVLDDIGRRCVTRDTARALFAARAAAEERRREISERNAARAAADANPTRPRGVPAVEGMTAYESMLAASGEDEQKKDLAADRMWRLARGESWGGTIPRGGGS